ncbi:hypothetical protein AHF37_06984 [Paragonimus kellicotti]|nr:hypothetical protein AHF37_06984 [Paragonimus kellicotti]
MSRNPTLSSGGNTYIESVVSVVDDLISDRAIWRKVVCIILCLVFLLNAWAVIVLHLVNFTNETVLEVSVSVAVLIAGQYVEPNDAQRKVTVIMSRNPTLSSGGNTYIESVVSVVDDLISDRAIWRKVVCIILCLVFLLNAWAVIVLHLVNFTNETVLEVSVSVAVLIAGQYVEPNDAQRKVTVIMSRNPTLSSGGNTYIESVVSVVDDLISDRAIWRKVVCIILCLVFLLNAWAVIVLHLVNFTNETVLEVSVSVAVLIAGQYVGTGIVDGYLYWRRWSKTSHKSHSREQEENKEAWVCMRITLSLLGMAPVSRYIDSLVVVRRMLGLENNIYLRQSLLPKNAPTMSVKQSASIKSNNTNQPMSASRLRALDAGLVRVYKVRRQFRRTEQDAALVALANGVVGAGPFVISQGVLYFRRVGLNYSMALTTMLGILSCSVTGLVWLCAGLTHFHPAAFDQSEVDFERGIGQVPITGLILLFFTHLVHVTLRSGCLMLFTAQFYWIVLGVLGFHLLFVLSCLIVARLCTRDDYSNPSQVNRSSISGNLLSDIMFSYVGLFEFANAYAKYTRTRYFLYYLFYYLENAAMIGAWYVHFTYPQMWYYLPALLVITVAQLLGFILLQVYLYFFSRSRRKTTLCGLCFVHKDPDSHVHFQSAHTDRPDLAGSLRRFESLHTPSALGLPATSVPVVAQVPVKECSTLS